MRLRPALLLGLTLSALAQAQTTADLQSGATSTEWLTYGHDYAETRFSTLTQINAANVGDLGVAWTFDTDSFRGLEATPLMKDGVLYVLNFGNPKSAEKGDSSKLNRYLMVTAKVDESMIPMPMLEPEVWSTQPM